MSIMAMSHTLPRRSDHSRPTDPPPAGHPLFRGLTASFATGGGHGQVRQFQQTQHV